MLIPTGTNTSEECIKPDACKPSMHSSHRKAAENGYNNKKQLNPMPNEDSSGQKVNVQVNTVQIISTTVSQPGMYNLCI